MTALATCPAMRVPARLEAPHLMGAGLPPALRTVGALAALLLAVAVTGVVLVAFAVVMPFALVATLILRRGQPPAERSGWRPASA